MTDTPATYQAIIHKANVPLAKGESLHAFMKALKDAAKPHLLQKFNVDEKDGGAWPIEVFADKAVFMIAPEWSDVSKDVMVAFKFERKDDGDFSFGETQKVKAVTSFEITKRVEVQKAMEMNNWATVEAEAQVEKSFWSGVV